MAENLDGPLIAQWARRAAARLRERQSEINALNVFPIPDSDTGSNMAHTMTEAAASTAESDENNLQEVTAALASGAVRGARGNSGMVLSQVFRSLADTAAKGPVDGTAVAAMLSQSVDFAKSAIAAPVEGTIVSVLRAAAEGAAAGRETLADVVGRALASAERALDDTPQQLDVLAKAGVVDAGGRGLVVILQALYDTLNGADNGPEATRSSLGRGEPEVASNDNMAEIEVMFMFASDAQAMNRLRTVLDQLGNSVVVAEAGSGEYKVHVHTREGGTLIERAYELGRVYDLRLEVLPEAEQPLAPIIALTPSGGVAAVFEGAGAIALDVDTADTTAIEQILRMTGAGPAIVLTNGRDASRLLASNHNISVIDTSSLVGGLAALAVHDSSNDVDDDLEDMADAVAAQRFAISTAETLRSDAESLLAEGGELVTVLWSVPELTAADIEGLRQHIAAHHPDVEFHDYQADGMGHAAEIGVE